MDQKFTSLKDSTASTLDAARAAVEEKNVARLRDLQSRISKEQEAATATVQVLQSQFSQLQLLPQQHKEMEQQMAQVHQTVDASIKSAVADVDRQYQHILDGLHQEQQQQAQVSQEAAKRWQSQQSEIEDNQRQLADLRVSLESSVQSGIAVAVEKQQQHLLDLIRGLETKQMESQQAAKDSGPMLQGQKDSLQQLSQELQEARTKLDQLQDDTAASIELAVKVSDQWQQERMGDLRDSLQAKQSKQQEIVKSVQVQQSGLAELPKHLLDVQGELTTMKEQQAGLQQLPPQMQEAATAAVTARGGFCKAAVSWPKSAKLTAGVKPQLNRKVSACTTGNCKC